MNSDLGSAPSGDRQIDPHDHPKRTPARFPRANSLQTAMALSLSAGYLDGVIYTGHGHVFASAMTGNMVLLGINLAALSPDSLKYAVPLLAYATGVVIAHTLMREAIRTRLPIAPHVLTLLLEIVVLLGVAYSPFPINDRVLVPIITISTSMQNTSFRTIGEQAYNSVIMTGNLQAFSNALAGGVHPWNPSLLRKAGNVGGVLVSFLAGATIGTLLVPHFGNHAIIGPVILFTFGVGVLLTPDRRAAEAQP